MVTTTIARSGQEAIDDEVKRTILREALRRYRCELMDMDEREEVWSRIVLLRRRHGLA